VAHRLFAAEFEDADLSYSESDEERAPNYVVTPTGARINRLFAVGVLTEVEHVNEDVLRGRVVDPTGAFVTYAGQYQPDPMTFLERASPPAFVALSGKARTFQPDDSDRVFTSVRPESVSEVDASTRDRWIVDAAEATLYRVTVFAEALTMDERGDDLRAALESMGVRDPVAAGVPVAIDHYGTTPAYLDAVRRLAVDALETVTDDRDAVRPLEAAPDDPGGDDVGPIPPSVVPELGRDDATASGVPAAERDGEPTSESPDADASTAALTDEDADATETEAVDAPDAEGVEPAEEADEPEPTTATESAAEATDTGGDALGAPETNEVGDDALGAPETGDASAPADDGLGDFDDGRPATDDDPGDFDDGADAAGGTDADAGDAATDAGDVEGMYELDEAERREVEDEFGTEFSTGGEVDDPGEANIDVPDADDLDEIEADASAPTDDEPDPQTADEGDEPGDSADEGDDAADGADEVDLEDAVVAAMKALDDGDGADRQAVVASVVDDTGADPDAVEDAVQDALMGGRCYEPSDGTLKAI
jgi:RPA family protein